MRVAYNASPLLHPLTGVGHHTRELARALIASSEVQLFLFYASVWTDRVLGVEDLVTFRAQPTPLRTFVRRAVRPLGTIPRLARAIQQWHFSRGPSAQTVLYHEPNFLPYRFRFGPTVVTVHDLSWIHYPETQSPERVREMRRLFPLSLKRADHFIAVSEFGRRDMIDTLGVDPSRITAVPNGVTSAFAPRDRGQSQATLTAHGLDWGRYALCVGTLEPRKNLEAALRAHAQLPERLQRELPLAIVGMRGWRTSSLEAALRPRVEAGTVKPLGYVLESDLPHIYAGALALVYPSLYEGFGLPPLEAMASGTPVIVSNRSSLPEVVGSAGILVEPDDHATIAEALQRLLDDHAYRARLVQAGLLRAAEYSWERSARETLTVYRHVLEACR
jgi:alpha-1,3-rhamnosyl/mannosyltransferase